MASGQERVLLRFLKRLTKLQRHVDDLRRDLTRTLRKMGVPARQLTGPSGFGLGSVSRTEHAKQLKRRPAWRSVRVRR